MPKFENNLNDLTRFGGKLDAAIARHLGTGGQEKIIRKRPRDPEKQLAARNAKPRQFQVSPKGLPPATESPQPIISSGGFELEKNTKENEIESCFGIYQKEYEAGILTLEKINAALDLFGADLSDKSLTFSEQDIENMLADFNRGASDDVTVEALKKLKTYIVDKEKSLYGRQLKKDDSKFTGQVGSLLNIQAGAGRKASPQIKKLANKFEEEARQKKQSESQLSKPEEPGSQAYFHQQFGLPGDEYEPAIKDDSSSETDPAVPPTPEPAVSEEPELERPEGINKLAWKWYLYFRKNFPEGSQAYFGNFSIDQVCDRLELLKKVEIEKYEIITDGIYVNCRFVDGEQDNNFVVCLFQEGAQDSTLNFSSCFLTEEKKLSIEKENEALTTPSQVEEYIKEQTESRPDVELSPEDRRAYIMNDPELSKLYADKLIIGMEGGFSALYQDLKEYKEYIEEYKQQERDQTMDMDIELIYLIYDMCFEQLRAEKNYYAALHAVEVFQQEAEQVQLEKKSFAILRKLNQYLSEHNLGKLFNSDSVLLKMVNLRTGLALTAFGLSFVASPVGVAGLLLVGGFRGLSSGAGLTCLSYDALNGFMNRDLRSEGAEMEELFNNKDEIREAIDNYKNEVQNLESNLGKYLEKGINKVRLKVLKHKIKNLEERLKNEDEYYFDNFDPRGKEYPELIEVRNAFADRRDAFLINLKLDGKDPEQNPTYKRLMAKIKQIDNEIILLSELADDKFIDTLGELNRLGADEKEKLDETFKKAKRKRRLNKALAAAVGFTFGAFMFGNSAAKAQQVHDAAMQPTDPLETGVQENNLQPNNIEENQITTPTNKTLETSSPKTPINEVDTSSSITETVENIPKPRTPSAPVAESGIKLHPHEAYPGQIGDGVVGDKEGMIKALSHQLQKRPELGDYDAKAGLSLKKWADQKASNIVFNKHYEDVMVKEPGRVSYILDPQRDIETGRITDYRVRGFDAKTGQEFNIGEENPYEYQATPKAVPVEGTTTTQPAVNTKTFNNVHPDAKALDLELKPVETLSSQAPTTPVEVVNNPQTSIDKLNNFLKEPEITPAQESNFCQAVEEVTKAYIKGVDSNEAKFFSLAVADYPKILGKSIDQENIRGLFLNFKEQAHSYELPSPDKHFWQPRMLFHEDGQHSMINVKPVKGDWGTGYVVDFEGGGNNKVVSPGQLEKMITPIGVVENCYDQNINPFIKLRALIEAFEEDRSFMYKGSIFSKSNGQIFCQVKGRGTPVELTCQNFNKVLGLKEYEPHPSVASVEEAAGEVKKYNVYARATDGIETSNFNDAIDIPD